MYRSASTCSPVVAAAEREPVRPSRPGGRPLSLSPPATPAPRPPAARPPSRREADRPSRLSRPVSRACSPPQPPRPPPAAPPGPSNVSIRNPCSSASATPAEKSDSRTSPWRAAVDERGGRAGDRLSNSDAIDISVGMVTIDPANESSLSTRRHSGERSAARAVTSRSKGPARDTPSSSRRAARSSSATSGLPRDRSATSRRVVDEGRAPSIASISCPSSGRSSGATSTLVTDGVLPRVVRVPRSGSERSRRSGW